MSFMRMLSAKYSMVPEEQALKGRDTPIVQPSRHFVNGNPINPPYPDGMKVLVIGMGCFWGAERAFWSIPGVYVTAVGYAGGYTPNPTYQEVCTGQTGHTEVVAVVYDPSKVSLDDLLSVFWEKHDPTQGFKQGNDIGTQYRSAIYVDTPEELEVVEVSKARYQAALKEAGRPTAITTEIGLSKPFYFAEDDHQQYLAKNPNGYCGLGGTGVSCPLP
ncbi:peptide-methionine (S)-S-oxide reductase MsrA [Rhodobacteraceae bacterium RKSG542]|uniref:peptide-methionine (S)-S-oxide reductase MsrA n=1 Tax=Pseudovibrio flavus TaxID=2529854 RepID=UPI0012BBD2C1|nr:peptide-methionine (S)-S-oxide reductase MsrA [Pseudovibrio flavus]MTI17657.1 peptide-methionine (S)-S-oxide reductase MsrA [Pseudovibrio flavus]